MGATFEHPKPSDVILECFKTPLQQLMFLLTRKLQYLKIVISKRPFKNSQSNFKFDVIFSQNLNFGFKLHTQNWQVA